jgi:hypothetical protein
MVSEDGAIASVRVGDWIRFMDNGRLVIDQVEYLVQSSELGLDASGNDKPAWAGAVRFNS